MKRTLPEPAITMERFLAEYNKVAVVNAIIEVDGQTRWQWAHNPVRARAGQAPTPTSRIPPTKKPKVDNVKIRPNSSASNGVTVNGVKVKAEKGSIGEGRASPSERESDASESDLSTATTVRIVRDSDNDDFDLGLDRTESGDKRGPRELAAGAVNVVAESSSMSSASGSSDEDDDDDEDEDDGGAPIYVVERIETKRVFKGTTYYWVKWKGWDSSDNTWEPIEHLDGCKKLIQEYEARCLRIQKERFQLSDDEDVDKAIGKCQKFMKSYGVHAEWPSSEHLPKKVVGVMTVDGELTYVVQKQGHGWGRSGALDRSNTLLVRAQSFRKMFPQMVISYYQNRILWRGGA